MTGLYKDISVALWRAHFNLHCTSRISAS